MEKYKVLLVDDEENNLMLLYRTLRGKYDIVKTTSPLDAIELMKTQQFHIILSDHKMPEMDGVELLKYVYENHPEIVRILVTAYSDISILIGSINEAKIYRYIKKPFNPTELELVVEAGLEYFQLKKDNEILISDLKELFSGTIRAIIEALDAKDSYTLGRSRRVTYYSLKLAEKLGLSDAEHGRVELAGLLHDIGMIGVSDDVLFKTEKLTEEEFKEIKSHVDHGIRILEDIKQLKDVITIIKYHHEHYDGNGYPYGISGEDIPLSSRIIAIADAYDGMVSNRAYRQAMQPEDAVKVLEHLSGKQFDPELVQVFKEILPSLVIEIEEFEKTH